MDQLTLDIPDDILAQIAPGRSNPNCICSYTRDEIAAIIKIMQKKVWIAPKCNGHSLGGLIRKELGHMRPQIDKIPKLGMAAAQLLWSQEFLCGHHIGPFANVGDNAPPDPRGKAIAKKRRGMSL